MFQVFGAVRVICLRVYIVSVFKNGPSKICGGHPLKNLKLSLSSVCSERCLPKFLLSPFLNTLFHMYSFFCQYFTLKFRLTQYMDVFLRNHAFSTYEKFSKKLTFFSWMCRHSSPDVEGCVWNCFQVENSNVTWENVT